MAEIPKTMKAVRIHTPGDSSVLQVENDVPVPLPGDDQVLVKLEYAGINFIDTYQRSGLYPMQLPATSGREGAGTIVSQGKNVQASFGFNVGDSVAVFAQGSMAEYVLAPATVVLKLPPNFNTRLGAAAMLQGLTAWTMVQDAHTVEAGQTILVQAAAGGTGGLLVQMCKYLGATVIGTVSTKEKAEIATQHGCDHVILYKDQDVLSEVMKLTDGKGCHAVLSGVGQSTFAADLASTRRKGTFVTFGNSSGPVPLFKISDLSQKNVKLVRPSLTNYIAERDEFEQRSNELLDLITKGSVSIPIGGEYTLETLHKAHDDLTSAKTTGKLLVKIA